MYNEEQKNRFIADMNFSRNSVDFARKLFLATEKYEAQWNADICTRSAEEIRPVIDAVSSLRSSSIHTRINMLRRYVRWCKENGVPGVTDAVFQVYPDNTGKIKQQMVSGPLGLAIYLDKIFPPISEQSVTILFRCYYWLAFAGMKETDVYSVKKNDVDLGQMFVRFNGQDYPLYKEAADTFRLAKTMKSFYYKHKTHKERHEIERCTSEYLLSATEGVIKQAYAKTFLYKSCAKAVKNGAIKANISYSHAYLSGIFYRKFELERAIGEAFTAEDFRDVAEMMTCDREYSKKAFGKANDIRNMQTRIAKSYYNDYVIWKTVFSV